jgi:hypothetical protein
VSFSKCVEKEDLDNYRRKMEEKERRKVLAAPAPNRSIEFESSVSGTKGVMENQEQYPKV